MTTKILALTDALGNLVRFVLLPGHRFDTVGMPPLLDGVSFEALIADKAFDSDAIIADLNERGAKIVISQHPRRTKPLPLDTEIYKWRHLIENFFCKHKEFKRIAMRADKTDTSYNAIIHLAAAVINSRGISTGLSITVAVLISDVRVELWLGGLVAIATMR
jgi:transposase